MVPPSYVNSSLQLHYKCQEKFEILFLLANIHSHRILKFKYIIIAATSLEHLRRGELNSITHFFFILDFKRKKNFLGGVDGLIFLLLKKNPIVSAVSKILSYRQTYRQTSYYFILRIIKNE